MIVLNTKMSNNYFKFHSTSFGVARLGVAVFACAIHVHAPFASGVAAIIRKINLKSSEAK